MPNLPDFTKLPSNLQQSGDPVEGNPFSKDDLRHEVWESATRRAEEELSRLIASLAVRRPTEAVAYCEWLVELCEKKFDIWAKRGIHVVWSYPAVRAYDQWLFNFAEAWLQLVKETIDVPIPIELLLVELARQALWGGDH
jgi:hypothetical protein